VRPSKCQDDPLFELRKKEEVNDSKINESRKERYHLLGKRFRGFESKK
jgi:hypothetical protein